MIYPRYGVSWFRGDHGIRQPWQLKNFKYAYFFFAYLFAIFEILSNPHNFDF